MLINNKIVLFYEIIFSKYNSRQIDFKNSKKSLLIY
jgi:hypothetical protein